MPKIPAPATGSVCGKRVEQGAIAYQCTLSQGHEFRDAEPCYAVEVDRSVRVWRRWADEQEAKAKAAKAEAKAAPFDQERFNASVAAQSASFADELTGSSALVWADPPLDLIETPSEAAQQIRTIAAKAEKIVAKDPSLTPTLALWLATEQITRKDRAE